MKRIGDKPMTAAERTKRWRERNPERAKAVQQAYAERHPGKRQEISRAHYARNAESEKARSTAWRAANREDARRHRRASHHRNREADNARSRAWQKANMDKVRDYQNARRARKLDNGVFAVSDRDLRRIVTSPCAECGSNDRIEIDHIIPISRGGTHGIGNLQPLCYGCNRSKRSQLTVEWRRRKTALAA